MTATLEAPADHTLAGHEQYATFYVGDLLLGIDIRRVQEINRQLEITPVPGAPDFVRGVINLRGEVATVIDLRTILGLPESEETRDTRNLIVHSQDEAIGLWVDRISDILTIRDEQIGPSPSKVSDVDAQYFIGVVTLEHEIVAILNLDAILAFSDVTK